MRHSNLILIAISLLCTFGLSGCDKPGSAEQAGKKVDETIEKYENKANEQGAESAQVWADTEITTKVKAKLIGESGLKSLPISVNTVGGVVTLAGTTDSQANSDKATEIAITIDGVENVVNQLVVTTIQ
jgi:osmotically-inducible protein OsmY